MLAITLLSLMALGPALNQAALPASRATLAPPVANNSNRLSNQVKPATASQQGQASLSSSRYFGSLIGPLSGRLAHNTSGLVYAVDEQTLFIKGLTFDGLAPDTYFWSSTQADRPASQDGFIVPDEKGSTKPLERYLEKDVVLRLPEGKTLREINWLSIWSRQMQMSLAEIHISRQLIIPRPLEIGPVSELAHGLRSGPITIVDAQTFLVPDFHYDGLAPAAYFWLSRGSQGLEPNGLRLKDENGSSNVLKKYQGETLVISLPDELTVYDFDYFGVWCRQFQQNFGQVRIPQQARVPPSPKMLGIKPENKLNCEILYDDLGYEIRWVLDGDDIVMQLVGKIEPGEYMAFGLGKDDSKSEMQNADAVAAWVDRQTGQVHAHDYFLGAKSQCQNDPRGSCPDTKLTGGGDSLTLLHGAIVNGYSMVTFKRPQLGVDDQYDQHVYSDGQQSVLWAIGSLNAKQEIGYHRLRTRSNMFIDFARNPQWNCPIPDLNATLYTSSSANTAAPSSDFSTSQLVAPKQPTISSAASQVAPQIVSRAENAAETPAADSPAEVADSPPGGAQPQPSRINPQQPLKQQLQNIQAKPQANIATRSTQPQVPLKTTNQSEPWFVPSIVCPTDRTLHAQIGPTGAKRGFEGLTGQPSWGISWYINGLLIPELVLERGQSYRFVVEGGNDKTRPANRHPLYLTDSPEGGYEFKLDEERQRERIFGGVALRGDGQYVPTAEGRLCEWKQTKATLQDPDQYPSFAAYQKTLKLECSPGQASILKFTPDADTPDLIYYQCYSYRQMGWRIRLVNSCQNYLNSLAKPTMDHQATMSRQQLHSNPNNNIKRDTTSRQLLHQKPQEVSSDKYMRRSASYISAGDQYDAYNRNPFDTASDDLFRLTDFTNHQAFQQQQQQQLKNQQNQLNQLGNQNLNQNQQQQMYFQQQQTQNFPAIASVNNNNNQNAMMGQVSDLKNLSDDLLIMNAAQLLQKQPMNLSNYEQVLKLAPSDLEILDVNDPGSTSLSSPPGDQSVEDPFRPSDSTIAALAEQLNNVNNNQMSNQQLSAAFTSALWPKFQQFNQTLQQQQQFNTQKQNKTNSKTPKGLQVYIKRLASIYYPVQQQLASITGSYNRHNATQSSGSKIPGLSWPIVGGQSNQQQQSQQQQGSMEQQTPQASTSSFSLYNLMPKPKIDLSKSGISKKLNKLRFKGGWKAESSAPVGQVKPPTPQNEFNYDIFNNQLAQLEKQHQQLQSLESLALAANVNWPTTSSAHGSSSVLQTAPQSTTGTLNQATFGYLPNFQAAMDQANQFNQQQASQEQQQNQIEDQQAIDSMNQQSYPIFKPFNQQATSYPSFDTSYNSNQNNNQLANSIDNSWLNQLSQNQANILQQDPILSAAAVGSVTSTPETIASSTPALTQSNMSNAVFSPSKLSWSNLGNNEQQTMAPMQQSASKQHQQQSVFVTRLQPNSNFANLLSRPTNENFEESNQFYSGNYHRNQNPGAQSHHTRYNNWQHVNPAPPYPPSAQANQQQQQQFNGQPELNHSPFLHNQQQYQMLEHPTSTIQSSFANDDSTMTDSLSGSGSGAYFDVRQQPKQTLSSMRGTVVDEPISSIANQQQDYHQSHESKQHAASPSSNSDVDHMLAIERYSKQPSERQPPSIVHPITGEPMQQQQHSRQQYHTSQQNNNNNRNNNTELNSQDHHQSASNSRRYPQFPRHLSSSHSQLISSSSLPAPISSPLLNPQSTMEILDVEQSMRTSELRRVNATEMSKPDQQQQQATSQTVAPPSSTTPTSIECQNNCNNNNKPTSHTAKSNQHHYHHHHHHHHHEQPGSAGTQDNQQSASSAVMQQTTNQPNGFMQPENQQTIIVSSQAPAQTMQSSSQFNPVDNSKPTMNNNMMSNKQQTIAHRSKDLEETTIFRSNLIEPITSTLVPPFASSQFRFDPVPFTPIEINNIATFTSPQPEPVTQPQLQQQQFHQQHIGPGLRLRSTTPLETSNSMISLVAQPESPQPPPNKVASFLASRLISPGHQQQQQSQQDMEPIHASSSMSNSLFTFKQQNKQPTYSQQHATSAKDASNSFRLPPPASELIILKPSMDSSNNNNNLNADANRQPQSFMLKPEYLLTANNHEHEAELLYNNELLPDRLAAHQFDRLSSLSSPPTTSMMVDPLQAANTILSFTAKQQQANPTTSVTSTTASSTLSTQQNELSSLDTQKPSSQQETSKVNETMTTTTSANNTDNQRLVDTNERLAQHRKTILASKQQILPIVDSSQLLGDLETRLNPGGESALNSVLRADNKTDNAILSHVMSLIHSNALPTTSHLFPVGPYSRADYFGGGGPIFARSLFRT